MRELEVATLTADLGAEQDAGTLFIGKERSLSVTLHERESFVEKCGRDVDFTQQSLVDFFSQLAGAADQQDLFFAQFFKQGREPFDLRFQRIIRHFDRSQKRLTFRKSAQGGTRVAEHDAACAKLIKQGHDELFTGALHAGFHRREMLLHMR